MSKSGMFVAAVAVVLLVAEAAWTQEKVTLKQRYVPGDYVITMNTDKTNNNVVAQTSTKMLAVWQVNVSKADNGGLKIDLAYKRFSQSTSGEEGAMNFDSAYPNEQEDQQKAAAFKAFLDGKYTIMLDADGKVRQIKGFDETLEKIREQKRSVRGADAMRWAVGAEV